MVSEITQTKASRAEGRQRDYRIREFASRRIFFHRAGIYNAPLMRYIKIEERNSNVVSRISLEYIMESVLGRCFGSRREKLLRVHRADLRTIHWTQMRLFRNGTVTMAVHYKAL